VNGTVQRNCGDVPLRIYSLTFQIGTVLIPYWRQ